jgi:hypothetical protein
MTGNDAMSFVIPSFPADIPFLRIDGWLVPSSDRSTGLAQEMRARIDSHRGPLYVLYSPQETAAVMKAAGNYDLEVEPGGITCMPVTSNVADTLSLCPASKQSYSALGAL